MITLENAGYFNCTSATDKKYNAMAFPVCRYAEGSLDKPFSSHNRVHISDWLDGFRRWAGCRGFNTYHLEQFISLCPWVSSGKSREVCSPRKIRNTSRSTAISDSLVPHQ